MSEYYSRAGRPCSADEWAAEYRDRSKQVVQKTAVRDAEVSTVWLGLNHQFGDGPPLIFETMIFGGPPSVDQMEWRYSTEQQAIAGHKAAIRAVNTAYSFALADEAVVQP